MFTQYNYEPGSKHRQKLEQALLEMKKELKEGPFQVPCVIGSETVG